MNVRGPTTVVYFSHRVSGALTGEGVGTGALTGEGGYLAKQQ